MPDPHPRALDEPLSDAELDELEGFLASDLVPPDCMDLEMLDGFLTAIVSGPESVQPSEWQPLYAAQDARDWMFPIEALAFGDQDPEFAEWVDDKEKRASLVDELAVASVLIYRFWQDRRRVSEARGSGSRRELHETATRKSRQRLH